MRHRGWLLIGLAALAARSMTLLLRPTHSASITYLRPAYSQPDHGHELSAELRAAVAQELKPFAREEYRKELRGEPYVELGTRFEYAPVDGPDHRVAISVLVGGPVHAVPSVRAATERGARSDRNRCLIFTYGLIDGRWVELAKPRWETSEDVLRPEHEPGSQAVNDSAPK